MPRSQFIAIIILLEVIIKYLFPLKVWRVSVVRGLAAGVPAADVVPAGDDCADWIRVPDPVRHRREIRGRLQAATRQGGMHIRVSKP